MGLEEWGRGGDCCGDVNGQDLDPSLVHALSTQSEELGTVQEFQNGERARPLPRGPASFCC